MRVALDVAVHAKILPKLHGSQAEIEATLKRLLAIATGDQFENAVFNAHGALIDGADLPLWRTARKLGRMLYRLRANIPFERTTAERLLGLKDVATLYELWCYFGVVDAVSAVIGRRPDDADAMKVQDEVDLGHGFRVAWDGGPTVSGRRRDPLVCPCRPSCRGRAVAPLVQPRRARLIGASTCSIGDAALLELHPGFVRIPDVRPNSGRSPDSMACDLAALAAA